MDTRELKITYQTTAHSWKARRKDKQKSKNRDKVCTWSPVWTRFDNLALCEDQRWHS